MWKLDRLGRNTRHLLELLDDFKSRGINFRSLRDGIATDPDSEVGGATAQALVTIISAFAQLERDQLSERTRAGMAAAAAAGRKAGRREVTADRENVERAHELKARGLKPADIGKIIGASRATMYRYLRRRCESRDIMSRPSLLAWVGGRHPGQSEYASCRHRSCPPRSGFWR
ncbi:DNA invertase Pin-like site-specific DNA recombinase [Arthrobacter sp. MP_M4]|nr:MULTISPECIES: recombinase family protein [unclassified Arthrobacter]MEC5192415.1 DNA invertase Pin-like site-specific DNA recombinase [Arthrobacter sp. MP_M4]